MNITDLSFIEAEQSATVEGASGYYYYPHYYPPTAKADAYANALAAGYKTQTYTYTNAEAIAGIFAKSNSSSGAYAKGY